MGVRTLQILTAALALSLAACGEAYGPDPAQAVAKAYASVAPADRTGLRLAHLQAYFLVAARQTTGSAAAALASQGMLEIYDGQPGGLANLSLDEPALRRAAARGDGPDLAAALDSLAMARSRAGGDARTIARALTELAAGLYDSAVHAGGIDGMEYQHSLGCALAAQVLADSEPRLAKAALDLQGMIALYPGADLPTHPPTALKIRTQSARVAADLT